MAWAARPRERALARANLGVAFPDSAPDAKDRFLRTSAAALGANFFDMLAAERILKDPRAVRPADPGDEGVPPLPDLLRDALGRGRGLFLLTGHVGSWELLGAWMARELAELGLGPLGVVTGTVHNPAVDRLLQGRRRRLGMVVLPRDEGLRPLLAHLRRGRAVAVLLDQNIGVQTLAVPFFGRPAATSVGMARIALRDGVPVLPVAIAWDGGQGCHVVSHCALLEPGGGSTQDVPGLLARCNGCLERFIRRNPQQWVWFHDRWRAAGRQATGAEGRANA